MVEGMSFSSSGRDSKGPIRSPDALARPFLIVQTMDEPPRPGRGVRSIQGEETMAYDTRDDAVFEIAHAAIALATSIDDLPSPRHMLVEEVARISKVADRTADAHEGFGDLSVALARISKDYAEARIDDSALSSELSQAVKEARGLYSSKVVYEGVDVSDRDEMIRRDAALPGEQVSIAFRDDGRPKVGPEAGLGDGPLTVSGLFVTGERMPVDEDRSVLMHSVEYEFEGREGRHATAGFQAAGGQGHAYGVLTMVDDRLLMTPLDYENSDLDSQPRVAGATREILESAGRSAFAFVHPEGFEGLKAQVGKEPAGPESEGGPMVGEFNFDTVRAGDATGPVRIAGMPWTSTPSEVELDLAKKETSKFLAAEMPDLWRTASQTTFVKQAFDAIREAPSGLSEVPEGRSDLITHVVGKGSIDDPAVASDLQRLIEGRDEDGSASRLVVALGDAPAVMLGASQNSDLTFVWDAVDLRSGVGVQSGIAVEATDALQAAKSAHHAMISPPSLGILRQASALAPPEVPVAGKGVAEGLSPAVLGASVGRTGNGR
jgi:hypothetical protein